MRDLASVGGLGYRLVRKHARTEMLDLLISMFLVLGYIDKFSFIQPDDGQNLWPKHVVEIYV